METDPNAGPKTTQTSLRIIDALRGTEGATLDQLSEQLGLARSTVHRHLTTLREYGYVVKDGDRYAASLLFLTIGGDVQRRWTAYPKIKEKVDELAAQTGQRAQFVVEERGQRVYLYTEVGESAVQTGAHVGKRGPMHASAAGKAILASIPEERVREIVATHGLARTGDNTIQSESELREELDRVRERGYAFNRQETTGGVHAVGAAVSDREGAVVGALSVSGPAHRLKGDLLTEEMPERVLGAVNELELYIEHSVSEFRG